MEDIADKLERIAGGWTGYGWTAAAPTGEMLTEAAKEIRTLRLTLQLKEDEEREDGDAGWSNA